MNKINLSAAIAAALLAGQAYAATPVPLTGAGVPDIAAITTAGYYETFAAGSSAATPFLEEAMRADCVTGSTIYKYSFNGSLTYICSKADTMTAVTPPFLVLQKRDGGGSANAVKAANGTQMTFNVFSSLNVATACGTVANQVSTCAVPAAPATTVTQGLFNSEVNFADLDPAQFGSALNGAVAGAAGVASSSVATQIFGVVVNTRLRNALQVAQFGTGNACVGSDTEACMPNLTSAELASIFGNGRMTDWSKLRTGATTGTQNLFSVQALADQPGNRDIHICARTAGSGTWGTFNIKFENAPCNGGIDEAIQTPTAQTLTAETGANAATKIVHAMSGSGDVENCLQALNQGSAQGTFNTGTAAAPAYITTVPAVDSKPFRWAIGVMGVERNASGALPYRFIKIDGYAPSAHNVIEGKYKFWAELQQVGPAPTDALAIDLVSQLSDPVKIANLNVIQTWQAGQLINGTQDKTGFLGQANGAVAPSYSTAINGLMGAAYDAARPVNPYSHSNAAGGAVNHCRVPSVPNGASRVMPIY